MFSISINKEKNRIYIELGQIDTGEGEKFINQLNQYVSKLQKEFSAVSDIRQFKVLDPGEAKWADIVLTTLVKAGMLRAVRVTESLPSQKEIQEKYGYIVRLASSVEEADKILDEYDKK